MRLRLPLVLSIPRTTLGHAHLPCTICCVSVQTMEANARELQTMGRVRLFPVQIQKVLERVLHDVCLLLLLLLRGRWPCLCLQYPARHSRIARIGISIRKWQHNNAKAIGVGVSSCRGRAHVDNGVEAMITQYLFIEIIIIYDMGQTLCPSQCPVPCPFMCKAHVCYLTRIVLGIETVASLIELPANCLPRPAAEHNWKVLSQHPKQFLRVLANYARAICDECGTIAKCDKLKKHYEAWQSRKIHIVHTIIYYNILIVYYNIPSLIPQILRLTFD